MPPIKPLSAITDKWQRQAQASEQSYTEGIQNPRADWKTNTQAANANYKAAIAQSLAQDRFAKGVQKAGTEKWQKNALAKGPARWSQGISLATDSYATGFQPFADTIASTTLPARGPKGDPKNIQRVAVMAKALHDKKLSLQGLA